MMYEITLVNVRVYCPREPSQVITVPLEFVQTENGPVPLPCNGCELSPGGEVCEYCRAALTLMFYRDPDLDYCAGPITPRMPENPQ